MITYSLYLVPTRPSEMAIIIKSLKCSTNITQNISNIIYKRDAQVLGPFILILFNKLTEKHTFPDDLKRAKMCTKVMIKQTLTIRNLYLIYEPGHRGTDPWNPFQVYQYVLTKTLQKEVDKQLYPHLTNVLTPAYFRIKLKEEKIRSANTMCESL